MNNTKTRGQLRFVIYKRLKDKYFTGVCLDLDIVEQDEDPVKLKKSLEEAAQGYLETVAKNNLNDQLLNKQAPKKYKKILENLERYLHQLHQDSLPKNNFALEDSQFFTRNTCDLICA
ncbi:hypothetical protein A3F08_00815 [Candidatus Berkelbacteria bacterium RIFCSPHIGHO2_12_FULL_36_9]|uniref:Uncharacterized protein n=1 Tax=Candidatus Berkelbacteria bacterium RIFCSPHIGHO2_12_FULL_36_9 TaxID=1797469 RepID=A0A1F5EJJ0_9BACT|nr:MAG: hypothetical protein A3F08_00815 [Candidatus Berkelbacteria bacterium RIFCSPHIGHO2_12_FULL_36_9]